MLADSDRVLCSGTQGAGLLDRVPVLLDQVPVSSQLDIGVGTTAGAADTSVRPSTLYNNNTHTHAHMHT